MRLFWHIALLGIVLALASCSVRAEDELVTNVVVNSAPQQAATLVQVDAAAVGDGELNRETRQFGFYRPAPFYGRPRPGFYGGGFYRPPRPFYGGYYRPPRPFYGGYYRPPPFYGGFYG